jgi:hypothetical protein
MDPEPDREQSPENAAEEDHPFSPAYFEAQIQREVAGLERCEARATAMRRSVRRLEERREQHAGRLELLQQQLELARVDAS